MAKTVPGDAAAAMLLQSATTKQAGANAIIAEIEALLEPGGPELSIYMQIEIYCRLAELHLMIVNFAQARKLAEKAWALASESGRPILIHLAGMTYRLALHLDGLWRTAQDVDAQLGENKVRA